jgi:hypothetical protein
MLEERFQNYLISVMSNDHDQAEGNFSILATTVAAPLYRGTSISHSADVPDLMELDGRKTEIPCE